MSKDQEFEVEVHFKGKRTVRVAARDHAQAVNLANTKVCGEMQRKAGQALVVTGATWTNLDANKFGGYGVTNS